MSAITVRTAALAVGILITALSTPALATPFNFITNGGFEAGNTGFTSGYEFVPNPDLLTGLQPPKTYTIANNTKAGHPYWLDVPGDGLMMVVNGSTLASDVVWSQTVENVSPFTIYNFGASLLQQCCVQWPFDPRTNVTRLTFLINDVVIGTHTTTESGEWADLSTSWFSGDASQANLVIRNDVDQFQNNDFVLDNLSMTLADPVPEPATFMLLGLGLAVVVWSRRK